MGIIPLSDEQQPVQAAPPRRLGGVELLVRLLLLQTENVHESSSFAEVEPGLVVQVEAEVAAEEEEAGDEAVHRGRLEVVVALAHAQGLLEQDVAGHDVGAGHAVEAHGVAGDGHAGLEHHEGAERGEQAVGVDVLVGEHGLLLEAAAVQDGQGRIHVGEVELDALLDHLGGEQAGRGPEGGQAGRRREAIQTGGDLGGEGGLAVGFAQLADDICARALWALLLGDGMVGAGELGERAIATRVDAVALDLAAAAGVAGALDRRRHCVLFLYASRQAGRERRCLCRRGGGRESTRGMKKRGMKKERDEKREG